MCESCVIATINKTIDGIYSNDKWITYAILRYIIYVLRYHLNNPVNKFLSFSCQKE